MEQRPENMAVPAAKNSPNDIRIRKCRDTLVTGGLAVITFGIWTVIRSILEISNNLGDILQNMTFEGISEEAYDAIGKTLENNTLFYFVAGFIILLSAVDLIIRIYIGLSARAFGLQKTKKNGKERKGIVWIVFGFLLAAIGVYAFVFSIISVNDIIKAHSIGYFVVQVFVEGTSLFVTVELVITGIRLHVLTRRKNEQEEVRDAA